MDLKALQKRAGDRLAGEYLFSKNDRISVLVAERDGKLMAHNGATESLGLGWHLVDDSFLRKLGL